MKAGIGIIRKNNFFYTNNGSWSNLEAFIIDKDLEYIQDTDVKPCPDSCTLCIDSCPTKSLVEPYTMNRSTCVSCITTWEGWDLTKDPHSSQMGSWIFGCDDCQDVCPFNKGKWAEDENFPGLEKLSENLALEKIIGLDYDYLRDVIQEKLWYIPKDKVWRFKTNALNAMKNKDVNRYENMIKEACFDENEHVRNMAKWILDNHKKT